LLRAIGYSWPEERQSQNIPFGARICTPEEFIDNQHRRAMSVARARHGTINGRLKTWGILTDVFCHEKNKHHFAFRSVLVLLEIAIENVNGPFQVENLGDQII
jgi:hypothetical protein